MRSQELDLTIYDTDKVKSRYLERYDPVFDTLVNEKITLLEIGVDRGGPLLLWHDYFPKANIVGIDRQLPEWLRPAERVSVYEGSQTDTDFLSKVESETAADGFDAIIDDGSRLGLDSM